MYLLPVEYGTGVYESKTVELSGALPVRAQCLPFSQIPHTTQLFSDFISHSPKVQQFYPRSAYFGEWLKDEAGRIRYDDARRGVVTAILERQNRGWAASAKTLANIERFRRGAAVAVTGQQVGLFGGPAYSIYKALTAAKLADEATRAGVETIPVFWLATEDHDLAEVNHVSVPGEGGRVTELKTNSHAVEDAPVGTIAFGPEILEVVAQATNLLGEGEASEVLREAYRSGETFGSAFARLFAKLFADWGVVLLDPQDAEFHAIAGPIFHAAIERAGELDDALLARGKALESAGYHQQVKVTASSTLLFAIRNGVRTPVHRKVNGPQGMFLAGEEKISQSDLLRQIDSEPENFSANVLLRPVMQDTLLPTLTYVGGAAEVAYFAQGGVVYEQLLGRVTPVVPRFSATIVEQKPKALLERHGLSLPDFFSGPEAVRERLSKRALPQEIQAAFDHADAGLEKALRSIEDTLLRLDKTLIEATERSERKMKYQLNKLRSRAGRAELRRNEVLGRHADLLSEALYPKKDLQEREVGGIYFVARYGNELLRGLYDTIHTDCLDHQVIWL